MNAFLILMFLFFIGSCLGWVIELLYRHFSPSNKTRKWINPGFLNGPYLPIYGFGLVTLYLLAGLERLIPVSSPVLAKLILFLFMAVCMTLIEYVAGVIFIRGMKVKLWDYSNEPLNFQGIICIRFSLYWAALGALYYFLIHPYILRALEWFASNLAFSFVLGMFFGTFIIDFCYSAQLIVKIRRFADENHILVRYEELKKSIRDTVDERREKYKFMFALSGLRTINEHLKGYFDVQLAFKNADDDAKSDKK